MRYQALMMLAGCGEESYMHGPSNSLACEKKNTDVNCICTYSWASHCSTVRFVIVEPVSLTVFFARNSNSMEITPWYNSAAGHQIATNFCTCHDSTAVVPCPKFPGDHCIWIEVRVKRNFLRIWIVTEKPLMKWGEGVLFSALKRKCHVDDILAIGCSGNFRNETFLCGHGRHFFNMTFLFRCANTYRLIIWTLYLKIFFGTVIWYYDVS